jgi:RNA polymerase sigma-70 factor, ECF subfamily
LITDRALIGHGTDVPTPVATAQKPPSRVPMAVPQPPWTFDAVYEAHFAFVWRTVRRLGIVDSAVDDVAQETFLVVHRRLPTFENTAPMKSWLFGIITRVVSDARRSLRRKPANLGGRARSGEDVDSMADGASMGPHETVAKTEAIRTLHVLLDAMSDERRQVFILAELEQMSVVEIAMAVGANVNTVHSRLRVARVEFERAVVRLRARDAWRTR